MTQKRRLRLEPSSEDLEDLVMEDYVTGIRHPERRKIAERYGLLKWTPIYEREKKRAFREK